MADKYLLEDGTGGYLLEDGSGYYILEPLPALLVVGDKASLTAGDTIVKGRIEGLGWVVTVLSDSDAAPSEATVAMAILAESVISADVTNKYRLFTIGVMTMESGLTSDNDLATADGATGTATTTITLASSDQGVYQPLKAGFSGATTIAGSNINPTGNVSAEIPNGASNGGILNSNTLKSYWAYDTGATMENGHGAAEGRRVFFGIGDDSTYANLNANGLALLDAAITWIAPQDAIGTQFYEGTIASLVGTMVRTIAKFLTGSAGTPTGVTRKTPTTHPAGSAGTPSGVARKTGVTHPAGSAGTPAGSLVKTDSRHLAGGAGTPSGTLTKTADPGGALGGSAGTPAGGIDHAGGKTVTIHLEGH